MTGAPLIPVSIYGTQGILSKRESGFRPAPIHIWVEEPILPEDHIDAVDPVGSMMQVWWETVNDRLLPWFPDAEFGLESAHEHTAV